MRFGVDDDAVEGEEVGGREEEIEVLESFGLLRAESRLDQIRSKLFVRGGVFVKKSKIKEGETKNGEVEGAHQPETLHVILHDGGNFVGARKAREASPVVNSSVLHE